MDQIYPDDGLVTQLKAVWHPGVVYKLFVNDLWPDRDSVISDFTEPTWSGYAGIEITDTDVVTDGVAGHLGYIQADPLTWTNTEATDQEIFGFFVVDHGGTKLLAAARFDGAPLTIPVGEDAIVFPVWGDTSYLAGGEPP